MIVKTENAPAAIGPYSQAVVAQGLVFCSGQIALKPGNSELSGATAAEQVVQVMENLKNVLEAAGSSLSKVVRTTIFLIDMGDFAAVNEVYARYFSDAPPARATVAVAGLPKGAQVEIDAVATL